MIIADYHLNNIWAISKGLLDCLDQAVSCPLEKTSTWRVVKIPD
ncbi:hypothetical protein T12_17114 [Trichinella patagoniensis]|uniref:Uncharacterized protein n=1 Tax=Trichinella patagoniensis TaxID=990121 RepID=A0A0V0YSM8_9BILA|nr:hypothetical protein T12_17114 [Trichinella patagoniensis]